MTGLKRWVGNQGKEVLNAGTHCRARMKLGEFREMCKQHLQDLVTEQTRTTKQDPEVYLVLSVDQYGVIP